MSMNFLTIKKSAIIETIGTKTARNKWLACHGYGELSAYFIKKFEVLTDQHFIVAPEGLHRFYLQGFSGRIGANWMTKLHREKDISENSDYLNQVYQHYQLGEDDFFAFGFSQGTETITRWLASNHIAPKAIILWGNGLPDDLPDYCTELWKNTQIYFVIGYQDEFLTPERLALKKSIVDAYGLSYQLIRYEGRHKIYPDVLEDIVLKINAH